MWAPLEVIECASHFEGLVVCAGIRTQLFTHSVHTVIANSTLVICNSVCNFVLVINKMTMHTHITNQWLLKIYRFHSHGSERGEERGRKVGSV